VKLTEITKEAFDNIPQSKKLLCDQIECSHKFAYLAVKDDLEPILLCWQSDLIKPEIIDNERNPLIWFGIDQQIIAIDKLDGKIILLAKLETPLLQIFEFNRTVFLRTELEIYSFSKSGGFQAVYSLPEISEAIIIKNNGIKIGLMDGQIIDIPF
jgi:hypothetical protein